MKLEFTAVFKKVPEGYVAFVEELPGANTQGNTLEEARANLDKAVMLVLAANRALAEENLRNTDVIRERYELPA
ncbi:MAG: type II toxin-antitoxin system HicB family antitoxin [Gammaproteobacteria bacterium]